MLRFIVAVVMTIIIIKIAEDNPHIATAIMSALYIGFVIYSSAYANRTLNTANRNLLMDRNKRKIYYGMVVPVDEEKEKNDSSVSM